jgi:hypothetical protein
MQAIQGLRNARRLVLVLLAFLLLATVIAPAQAQAQADCPSPLRIAFLDKAIPGMLNGDGDRFDEAPGLFVEWARSTLQRLGCSAELVRVPQRRLLFDTASNTTQVSFYFAHTAERAQRLVYPLRSGGQPERNLALAETRLAFFVRADRRAGIQWDGVTLQPADLRVGFVGGGVEEALAMAAGWKLDRALSHSGSIAKLRAGHVDLALLPSLSFTEQALATPPALQALDPPLHRIAFFAPVSPVLMAQHPRFVRRFWRQLCEVARAKPAAPGHQVSCQG